MVNVLRIRTVRLFAHLLLLIFYAQCSWPAVCAQDETTKKLTLHPASPVEPLLKYRLLPPLQEQTPGNAAVVYGKVLAEQRAIWHNTEYWESQDDFINPNVMSLEQIRLSRVAQSISKYMGIFSMLIAAGRCSTCDWQLPVYEGNYCDIVLPEVQQSRFFSKLISLHARWQMANGDFEAAFLTIQSGFALARHVSNAPTFVNPKVGSDIIHHQYVTLIEWVQQPDAPNLYWALSTLPDPIIDYQVGNEAILAVMPLTFDFISHLESDDYSDEYWADQLSALWEKFKENDPELLATLELQEKIVAKGYPLAKSRLLQSGMSSERVDSMSVAQVVLMQGVRDFQRQLESRFRWTFLPYAQAIERLGDEAKTSAEASDVLPLPLFYDFPFADSLARDYQARRCIALLRTIEAIRMHAAADEGRLPPTLDAITEVPVPNDPVSGLPFSYQVEGETAVISVSAYKSDYNRFELTIGTRPD